MRLPTLLTLTSLLSLPLSTLAIISNDIVDTNVPCKPLSLIYARGYIEPGNIGVIVGPELSAALRDAVGYEDVAVQGVEYNSFMVGIDPEGPGNFIDMVKLAREKCPETVIAISGYRLVAILSSLSYFICI
jgi:cutinase